MSNINIFVLQNKAIVNDCIKDISESSFYIFFSLYDVKGNNLFSAFFKEHPKNIYIHAKADKITDDTGTVDLPIVYPGFVELEASVPT